MSLITIDQLLESVDLDFEPRWVTKSEDNWVIIWGEKPFMGNDEWYHTICRNLDCGYIKLAEFDGKDWTECIYEVPRKTTGKIEKLEKLATIVETINALNQVIDTVNKHADIIRQIGQWGSSKGECLWCETLTKFEPKELKGAKNE